MKKAVIIFTLLLPLLTQAQNTNIIDLFRSDFRQAEIYFKDFSYRNAIELYQRELTRNPKNFKAALQIAESYRMLRDTRQAENWYAKALEAGPVPAETYYHYGQVLSSNGKYDLARKAYLHYQGLNPGDSRIESKLSFLDNMEFYLRDSSLYHVEISNINSPASDFGANYYQDGIVFLSSRDQELFIKHQASPSKSNESLLDLYYSKEVDLGTYSEPVKFQQQINSKFHEGPLSFGPANTLVFTRSNYYKGRTGQSSDGQVKLKLFFAELGENRSLKNLTSFTHNNDEYSTAHPSLTEDGQTMYFSSDMPGGKGGADLYITRLENGQWTEPENLGTPINTEGDEMFPFITENQLFFSSNGHGGLGGLDNFFSILANGRFSDVVNLGYPANSNQDDFSFVMHKNGRQGLFSSDRQDGQDNIYNYYVRHSVIAGHVIEEEEGYLIDNADIRLLSTAGELLKYTTSDANGAFFLDVPLDTEYEVNVSKEGYTASYQNNKYEERDAFNVDSLSIYMWAHDLFAEGTIYGNETQQALAHVHVVLTDFSEQSSDTVTTDETGAYRFLLRHGHEYQLSLSKELFVPLEQSLNTLNITKGTIRNDFLMEEQFIEKGLVLFDFNEDDVKPDFYPELRKILKVLKGNPSSFLVISAHADSRGTEAYNLKLSEKRAKNALNYFIQNGIDKGRIISRAFGEALVINRCSDGINCHEEEHSKNRRVELKIERELPTEELTGQ